MEIMIRPNYKRCFVWFEENESSGNFKELCFPVMICNRIDVDFGFLSSMVSLQIQKLESRWSSLNEIRLAE